MKYQTIIALILCMSFISSTAYSFDTDPSKYDMACNDKGGIIIRSPDNIDTSGSYRVNMIATDKDNKTFNVAGTWKGGIFTSEEAQFNEQAEYTITITFASIDTVKKAVDCPGLVFSCRIFSTSISRCYNYDGAFYALFEIENKGKYDWNLNTNLTYIASDDKGKSNDIDPQSKIEKIDISDMGNDRYSLKWTTDKNIELFHIKAPICKTTTSKICTEPEICTEDSDCLEFEYCDGYCKRLDCTENEYISGHGCIAYCRTDKDCDDNLACTIDRCRDYACSHEQVTCTAQEKCTTAECKEPAGCIYRIDEECKKSESSAKTSIPLEDKSTKEKPTSTGTISATTTFLLIIILILVAYIMKRPEAKPIKEKETSEPKKTKKKQKDKSPSEQE
ncbi:MAG: hypothetical protein ABIG84_02870 [archaeon]